MDRGFVLHICLDLGDEDIARHHAVFGGEAVGEVFGVEDLGVGGEFVVTGPHEDLDPEGTEEVELIALVAVAELPTAQLFAGGGELTQLKAEGEGGAGQDPAGVGGVVHLAPGHLPEGLPGAQPHLGGALQQSSEQEGLHGQGRNGGDGIFGPGDGILGPQQGQPEGRAVKGHEGQPGHHVRRVQCLEFFFIKGKGDLFLVVFDVHFRFAPRYNVPRHCEERSDVAISQDFGDCHASVRTGSQ